MTGQQGCAHFSASPIVAVDEIHLVPKRKRPRYLGGTRGAVGQQLRQER